MISIDECPICGAWAPSVADHGPPWFEGSSYRCAQGHDLVVQVDGGDGGGGEHDGVATLVEVRP